jgi:CheY-like chemotaxis protein
MNGDGDRAYAAGFDGYVQKPLSVRALQQQVHDFLTPRGGMT